MHPFDHCLPGLEQGLYPLKRMLQIPMPPANSPYARARALLLLSIEGFSQKTALSLLSFLNNQDIRRDIALIHRAEARQEASLQLCRPEEEIPLERSIFLSMLGLELSAVLAQRLPDSATRQALHFALPELLDEVYRLSNLLMLFYGKNAHELLGGYVEIMPGRPLIACQRHPYDEIKKAAEPACILESMAPLMLSAVCYLQRQEFLACLQHEKAPLARALFQELSLISAQHLMLFESLIPEQSPLEQLLLCQYTEGDLYHSCAQEEENAALRQMYLEEAEHEFAHIRKTADLCAKKKGIHVSLPDFPLPLRLGPNKGYVREVLQNVGGTAHREGYIAVGQLPPGADFFRYQDRLIPREEEIASYQIISQMIEKTGSDYRFEIAPHPIEALRNRRQDNTQVGRKAL